MGWLGDLIALGGTAITGGVTGLLGMGVKSLFAWLGARQEIERVKIQNAHELAVYDAQAKIRLAETESAERIEQIHAAGAAEVAAEERRKASYGYADLSSGQKVWKAAASIVVLMRPAITLTLLAATFYLFVRLTWGDKLPGIDGPATITDVVKTITYLTAVAVTWWFGDRPPATRTA